VYAQAENESFLVANVAQQLTGKDLEFEWTQTKMQTIAFVVCNNYRIVVSFHVQRRKCYRTESFLDELFENRVFHCDNDNHRIPAVYEKYTRGRREGI
jgi:hypothetical protein